MKRGIIFDLDGTLWDACASMSAAWNQCIRDKMPGCTEEISEETARGACGLSMDLFWKRVLEQLHLPAEELDAFAEECSAYELEYMLKYGGNLYPETIETLQTLAKQYHLFIVSNCQKDYAYTFAKWSGLEVILDDIEEYGRSGKYKTENIIDVVKRNHLDQAIYVGDTKGDEKSAAEAGVPFVYASYGFGRETEREPAAVLKEIKELLQKAPEVFERCF